MTAKVLEIISANDLHIICKANNGKIYEVDVKPLLKKHSHLEGIKQLYEPDFFKKVTIGEMGELTWRDAVKINENVWNYDISPEFVIYNSTILKSANH